jgi:cytochrome c553
VSEPVYVWSNIWFRRSITWLVVLTVLFLVAGFVWLPAMHADFTEGGIWASICRAAGRPTAWGTANQRVGGEATKVVLDRSMATTVSNGAVGRGATLARNCSMCHGAQGTSASDAPNLAGQYPEVVIKQLEDYRAGKRTFALMEGLAKSLGDDDIRDLAAYYASLPKGRNAPTTYDEPLPALVRVGDPLRNIAPCIACHGGIDQKFGAPWLEGMPKAYLLQQLAAFKSGTRHNDSFGQMRNMARPMTESEIDEAAAFYARKTAERP